MFHQLPHIQALRMPAKYAVRRQKAGKAGPRYVRNAISKRDKGPIFVCGHTLCVPPHHSGSELRGTPSRLIASTAFSGFPSISTCGPPEDTPSFV